MDNKFPGKDVSEEDIKTKFPLVAKKFPGHKSSFNVSNVEFGGAKVPIFAGPNMIESKELIEDIRNYVKENLATYKAPREIEFVNNFVMTSSGKINRRVLRENEKKID